jgi:predicted DNA binding protein
MDTQSDKVDKLVEALINARKDMDGAVKNGKGNWGAYASLEDLLDCCMTPLLYNGIMLTQPTIYKDGENQIVTQLTHISGQFMRSSIAITVAKENDPQKALAGQTYARRGGVETMLSIPRIDDDGTSSNGAKKIQLKPKNINKKVAIANAPEINEAAEKISKELNEPMPDDIPFDGIDELLTENQRRALVKQAKTLGVPIQDVVGLIKGMGYKTSAKVPQSKYGLLKSMIGNLVARGEDE